MHRVTFIALVLTVACGKTESKPPPAPAPPPVDGIEVLSAGQEPRRLLRYKLAPGAITPLELRMDLDARLADLTTKLPTLVLGADLTVATMDPDGTAHMKLTVVSGSAVSRSEADAGAMPIMERSAKLLVGTVVTYVLTPAGQIKDAKIEEANRDLSEPMQDQTRTLLQASEQLAMALPDKPIGAGATYKHRRTLIQNQITLLTITTVEVTAIDGDQVSFKSTTELRGADQTITNGSATVQVKRVGGTGSQTGTFDLGQAIAVGEIKASLGMDMIIATEARATSMDVNWKIARRP